MGGKAFGRITRGERCRGQRHAVSISLVPEIRMFSPRARAGMKMDRREVENSCTRKIRGDEPACLTRDIRGRESVLRKRSRTPEKDLLYADAFQGYAVRFWFNLNQRRSKFVSNLKLVSQSNGTPRERLFST